MRLSRSDCLYQSCTIVIAPPPGTHCPLDWLHCHPNAYPEQHCSMLECHQLGILIFLIHQKDIWRPWTIFGGKWIKALLPVAKGCLATAEPCQQQVTSGFFPCYHAKPGNDTLMQLGITNGDTADLCKYTNFALQCCCWFPFLWLLCGQTPHSCPQTAGPSAWL